MIAPVNNSDKSVLSKDLEHQHFRAVAQRRPWQEILQAVCEHAWFLHQLQRSATKAVRRAGLKSSEIDDVRQQAVVVIAGAIQRNPMLGFDDAKGSYASFLATIIYRACLKALRQFGQESTWQVKEDFLHPTYYDQGQREQMMDLQHVAGQIPDPYRSIVKDYCAGKSIEEIADARQRSTRTIYRLMERSIDLMQVIYFGQARS